jgi:hypothetical protein
MLALTAVGLARPDLGQHDEAVAALAGAADLATGTAQHGPDRADILLGLARSAIARGRPAEVRSLLGEAARFWREFAADAPEAREVATWLARLDQFSEEGVRSPRPQAPTR